MRKRDLKQKSGTDWDHIDAMKDEEIDFSDIPELGEDFFRNASLIIPERKSSVTLRLDPEVVEWFKSRGKGYQTRINAVLKAYVKAQSKHP